MERHDVTFLQEIRGRDADIQQFSREFPSHIFYHSVLEASNHGGVLIAIKHKFARRFSTIVPQELCNLPVLLGSDFASISAAKALCGLEHGNNSIHLASNL